jgi:uncharacterized protein YceK
MSIRPKLKYRKGLKVDESEWQIVRDTYSLLDPSHDIPRSPRFAFSHVPFLVLSNPLGGRELNAGVQRTDEGRKVCSTPGPGAGSVRIGRLHGFSRPIWRLEQRLHCCAGLIALSVSVVTHSDEYENEVANPGANRRRAGQSGGSDNLSATVSVDRAFPAAVAELGRQAAMRVIRLSLTLVVLVPLLTAGCGTLCNQLFTHQPGETYGGVRFDIDTALEEKGSGYLIFLDIPISAVFDTLLLPVNLWDKPPAPQAPAEEIR